MRVTEASRFRATLHDLDRATNAMAAAQHRLSSGRRIDKLSDDPAAAVSATRMRNLELLGETRQSATSNGLDLLGAQDTALQSASDLLAQARALTIDSAQDLHTPEARAAIAAQLDEVRDQLVGLANTSFDGRSMFGGHQPKAVESVAGVVGWLGDSGRVDRRIAPDLVVQVNLDGQKVFGFDTGDSVFSVLNRLADQTRSGDVESLGTDGLADLAEAANRITDALGVVGAKVGHLDRALERHQVDLDQLKAARSELVDTDLAEAAVEFSMAENALTAALGAAAKLNSMPSLLDFLR